jgi:two-component system chemotaxis response regulator CheY
MSTPILIVDDYQTMLRIERNLLTKLGFTHIEEASDGEMALEMLRLRAYGLILSDWNMQPVTGFELLKIVRAEPEMTHTPFIMVTAESKMANVVAARQAGVSEFIIKPFSSAVLKAKLKVVLGDF